MYDRLLLQWVITCTWFSVTVTDGSYTVGQRMWLGFCSYSLWWPWLWMCCPAARLVSGIYSAYAHWHAQLVYVRTYVCTSVCNSIVIYSSYVCMYIIHKYVLYDNLSLECVLGYVCACLVQLCTVLWPSVSLCTVGSHMIDADISLNVADSRITSEC